MRVAQAYFAGLQLPLTSTRAQKHSSIDLEKGESRGCEFPKVDSTRRTLIVRFLPFHAFQTPSNQSQDKDGYTTCNTRYVRLSFVSFRNYTACTDVCFIFDHFHP